MSQLYSNTLDGQVSGEEKARSFVQHHFSVEVLFLQQARSSWSKLRPQRPQSIQQQPLTDHPAASLYPSDTSHKGQRAGTSQAHLTLWAGTSQAHLQSCLLQLSLPAVPVRYEAGFQGSVWGLLLRRVRAEDAILGSVLSVSAAAPCPAAHPPGRRCRCLGAQETSVLVLPPGFYTKGQRGSGFWTPCPEGDRSACLQAPPGTVVRYVTERLLRLD